jgi:hypothetical protein
MPLPKLSRKSTALVLLAAGWISACAAVLGIEDGTPRDDGGAGGDASLPVIGDGTVVTDDASGGTCEAVLLRDELGVFVTVDGADTPSCGTRGSPCKTVGAAIARAVSLARPGVYIAAGTYVETVTLRSGIDLIGGWNVLGAGDGAQWSRACSSQVTTLKAGSDAVTVRAPSLAGQVTKLSTLTIASRDGTPSPGESPVGVLATGGTTLQLVAVDVRAGSAGVGVAGARGDAGAPGGGDCDAGGDGGPGTPPGPSGPSSDGGSFGAEGYVAGDGVVGSGGPRGQNGPAPGKGTCVECRNCTVGGVCANVDLGPSCGTDGKTGCGGLGGAGGAGGSGGGSSVALLAWDGAKVFVVGGSLRAGDGARGAAGAGGGAGGPGGTGSAGAGMLPCDTACGGVIALGCPTGRDAGRGGAAGGAGGAGAPGGTGGDGAGGNSYAIVQGGGANVVAEPSTLLEFGNAGAAGGPGAAAGHAGARAP